MALASSTAISPDRLDLGPHLTSAQTGDPEQLMLDEPVGELPIVDDARWSSAVTSNSLVALLWWCVMLLALFLAGLPWSRLLFPRLGDRASGLSRIVAWLGAGWVVWFLASLEIIAFRAVWSLVALAVLGGIGWLLVTRRQPHVSHLRLIRNSIEEAEAAFWMVFALFLFFRWINPDSWHPIWGGEKPMEFAHINAILRSAHFPPPDPWFSGGLLNYYYYGSYLVAYLMKLTGIPSEIAFNLAQPTVIALLASTVFTVCSALAGTIREKNVSSIGGWTGVLVVIFMGNLVSARNVIERLPDLPQPSFIESTWNPSRAISGAITEFPYFTALYADLHAHVIALPITVLLIATCLELSLRGTQEHQSDHAATIRRAVPLLGLLALTLGSLSATNAWDVPLYAVLIAASIWMAVEFRLTPLATVIACALAALATLLAAALLFLPFHRRYVALFSSIDNVRAPTAPDEWLLHLGGLLLLSGMGLLWLVIRPSPTQMAVSLRRQALLTVGAILAAISVALYVVLRLDASPFQNWGTLVVSWAAIALAGAYIASRSQARTMVYLAGIIVLAASIAIAWSGWEVLAAGIGIALLGATLWVWPGAQTHRFTGLLIAAAGSAVAGLELFYVVDDLSPDPVFYRMNTMFKIYNEVWIVLGIASAALAARLIAAALHEPDSAEPAISSSGCTVDFCPDAAPPARLRVEKPLAMAATVVVALGLVYPALATGPRLDQRFANHSGPQGFNALDWMDYGVLTSVTGETISFAGDRAAIDWFNTEVAGTPVIAEASIGPYRGNGSRISIATGLPTVIGWYRHERQQRYRPELDARMADIQLLYNAEEPQQVQDIIGRYGIEYIVVGDVERYTVIDEATGRTFASSEGLSTLQSMIGTNLEVAFESGGTMIYRVIDD
ncbi:MAG: DUF2298 domain-containing protein [Thermomicrobiales bacterium]